MLLDQPLDRPVPSYRKDLSVLTSMVSMLMKRGKSDIMWCQKF